MRAPSSFHSNAASPRRASASSGILGRLRQHRLHRPEQLDGKPREPGRPLKKRRLGHDPEIARQHRRPPHIRRRQPCRLRDRLDHHPLERPLPQFPDQQPHQKILLSSASPARTALSARAAAPPPPPFPGLPAAARTPHRPRRASAWARPPPARPAPGATGQNRSRSAPAAARPSTTRPRPAPPRARPAAEPSARCPILTSRPLASATRAEVSTISFSRMLIATL